jgi:IS30 family transposase
MNMIRYISAAIAVIIAFGARPVQAKEAPWCAVIQLGKDAAYWDCQYWSLEACVPNVLQDLGRSPSTISREIRRNGGSQAYRANWADRRAWERALRPKPCRLALHRELRWRVAQKLALQWSPEQIPGWLKQQFPTDRDMRISHEAIYRSLFVQTRGVLKKELTAQLRTRRQMRHAKGGGTGVKRTSQKYADSGKLSL